MKIHQLAVTRCAAIALVCAIICGSTARAETVLEGFDLFTTNTEEGLTMFAGEPFEGVPLGKFDFGGDIGVQSVLNTDTIVRRLETATGPDPATIPIELVALQLKSVEPIDLGGGLGFYYVTLNDNPSLGQMTVEFEGPDGGHYLSQFDVQADVRIGGLNGPIVIPDLQLNLGLEPQPWSRVAPPQALKLKGVNHRLKPDMSKEGDFWPGVNLNGWPDGCQPHGETGTFPASHCIDTAKQIPKWSQLPRDQFGENVPSDVDWRHVMNPPLPPNPAAPNWVVADDFRSNGAPILGVKWWGSYFSPDNEPQVQPDGSFASVVEDGFVISFHRDIPADATGSFSRPGELLATYTTWEVHIKPTEMIGWDGHRVWEYSVDLEDTHPEHLDPSIAEPDRFNERAGEIYWMSIIAENGHEMDEDWNTFPNNDPVELEHYWGWHTSPDRFNDVPVMGDLKMPDAVTWDYGNWNPVQLDHMPGDMAFELYTIPEPSTAVLWLLGSICCLVARRRYRVV